MVGRLPFPKTQIAGSAISPSAPIPEPRGPYKRQSKEAVLYSNRDPNGRHQCNNCHFYIPEAQQCELHTPEDSIQPIGSCGYFLYGVPSGSSPQSLVSIEQSGYRESPSGFSCSQCTNFISDDMDCRVVDPNTPGDDPGLIDPNASCNAINLTKTATPAEPAGLPPQGPPAPPPEY